MDEGRGAHLEELETADRMDEEEKEEEGRKDKEREDRIHSDHFPFRDCTPCMSVYVWRCRGWGCIEGGRKGPPSIGGV